MLCMGHAKRPSFRASYHLYLLTDISSNVLGGSLQSIHIRYVGLVTGLICIYMGIYMLSRARISFWIFELWEQREGGIRVRHGSKRYQCSIGFTLDRVNLTPAWGQYHTFERRHCICISGVSTESTSTILSRWVPLSVAGPVSNLNLVIVRDVRGCILRPFDDCIVHQ